MMVSTDPMHQFKIGKIFDLRLGSAVDPPQLAVGAVERRQVERAAERDQLQIGRAHV